MSTLTAERVNKLAHLAYKLCGYEVIKFGKGRPDGIVKCSAKTIDLMNTFQTLLVNEIDGTPNPTEEELADKSA